MKEYFLKPPGPIARWSDGLMVSASGLACILSYYLIKFDICGRSNCSDLKITKFWATLPELFIVYGLSVLLVGVYLILDKEIVRLYRLGIVVSALAGVVLSGMVVFGMGAEIGSAT